MSRRARLQWRTLVKVLTPAQRQQFETEGYIVVDNVLDPAREIAPVMDEFAGVLRLHSFYVRYRLPIMVELQHFEFL